LAAVSILRRNGVTLPATLTFDAEQTPFSVPLAVMNNDTEATQAWVGNYCEMVLYNTFVDTEPAEENGAEYFGITYG
jgi:hypothetical protein